MSLLQKKNNNNKCVFLKQHEIIVLNLYGFKYKENKLWNDIDKLNL